MKFHPCEVCLDTSVCFDETIQEAEFWELFQAPKGVIGMQLCDDHYDALQKLRARIPRREDYIAIEDGGNRVMIRAGELS